MAKFLKKQNITPDLILTSTAVRAFDLANIIADNLDYKKKKIIATKELYMAGENEMLNIVKDTDDKTDIVFLVAHNPGITQFANSLCNQNIDNIPTSGIFCVEFEVDSWKDINHGKGKFKSFDYPKKYLSQT